MTRDHQRAYTTGLDQQNKRGILFTDDFKYSTPYVITGTGADYTAARATEAKYFGEYGMAMKTRITAPAPGDYVQIAKQISYPESERLVIGARVGFPDVSKTQRYQLTLLIYDGSQMKTACIELGVLTPYLKCYKDYTDWEVIPGYGQTLADHVWGILEWSIDLATREYIEVTWLGKKTSISGIQYRLHGATAERRIMLESMQYNNAAAWSKIYVDSLYISEFDKL